MLGLALLFLAGFPSILRALGPRHLPNGVPSGELQIPIMTLTMMALQSLGIMMGIMITVVGVVSSLSKKKEEPVEDRARDSSVPTLNQIRNNVCG
jgi:uncharacterized membrane protein